MTSPHRWRTSPASGTLATKGKGADFLDLRLRLKTSKMTFLSLRAYFKMLRGAIGEIENSEKSGEIPQNGT